MSSVPYIADDSPKAEQADYKSIALLSACHFADDLNQGAVPAMLPFFIAAYHLSYTAAAGLVLAQTLFSSVAQPLFGLLADWRPSAWLIPVGLSFAGIGVAATALTHSYSLIFAAIAVSGMGVSAFHPEAARRVKHLGGQRAATSMSLFTVGGMAGFATGPILITPTLIAFGTRGAMLLALPVVIMSLTVAYQLPRLAVERAPRGHEAVRSIATGGREQWSAFARLTVVVVLRSIVFFGLNTFIPLYWSHVLHGSEAGGGYALTTMLSAVVAGTLIGGRMADRYGRKSVIVAALAALTPLLFLFLSAHGLAAAGLLLVPVGIALAAPTSVMVVMAQEYLPDRIGLAAGATLGLSMTVGGLLMPAFGAIADHHGLRISMTLLALIPALGFAMSLTLHEPSQPARA